MGVKQWSALFRRAGFNIIDIGELNFNISTKDTDENLGEEIYEWYIIEKSV
jgi:hypothetical protein